MRPVNKSISSVAAPLFDQLEALLNDAPNAEDFKAVNDYYYYLRILKYQLIDLQGNLEKELAQKSMAYLASLSIKEPAWIKIKNSSTMIQMACNSYAGETYRDLVKTKAYIDQLTETQYAYNTLVSAFKTDRQ